NVISRNSSRTLLCFGSRGSCLPAKPTGSPCGNEADLLSRRGIPPHGAGMSNVLVVPPTVRMLHRIHGHTTNLGPAVPLHTEFVVSIASLEKWLFRPTTTCNLADHCSASTWNNFLCTGRKLDPADSRMKQPK